MSKIIVFSIYETLLSITLPLYDVFRGPFQGISYRFIPRICKKKILSENTVGQDTTVHRLLSYDTLSIRLFIESLLLPTFINEVTPNP